MASIKFLKDGTYHRLDKFTIMQLNEQGVINQTLHDLSLQENEEDGLIYIYYKGNTVGEGMETGPRYGSIVTNLESLGILEGQTGGFRVKLSKRPSADQIVEIVSNDTNIASISPSSLTFTPTNWNVEQVVTVSTVEDEDDEDASTSITLTTTNNSKVVPVEVTDKDEFFGQILCGSALTIDEAGSGTFTVKLDQKPTNNQIVNIAGDSIVSVSPSSLVFTPIDWNVEQTVTVSAGDDDDSGDKQATVTLTSTNSTKTVNITVKDNDLPTQPDPNVSGATYGTVLTSHGSIAITEGSTFTLQIKLKEQPTGVDRQVVIISSRDEDLLSISPGALIFTPANYNVAQDVILTANPDLDEDNSIVAIDITSNDSTGKTINANIRDVSDSDDNYPTEPALSFSVYNNRTVDPKWEQSIRKKWSRIPVATRQYINRYGGNVVLVDPEQDSTVWVEEAGQNYTFTNVAGFTSRYTTYLPTRESSIEASCVHEMGHILINILKNRSSRFSSAWSGSFQTAYNQEKANVPFLMDTGSETNFNHHTKNTTEYYPEIFEYIIEKRIPVSTWQERAPQSYQLCRDMIDLKYN